MSNLDNDTLECKHTTEPRKQYDGSIDGKKKTMILCEKCANEYETFGVVEFYSKPVGAIPQ